MSSRIDIKPSEKSTQIIFDMTQQTYNIINKVKNFIRTPQAAVIYRSMFYTLFSLLDALTSDLLTFLYISKKELLNSIERTCTAKEILENASIDEVLHTIIEKAVEPVFANITRTLGLDRFTLRGRGKVDTQWKLFCMGHNIGKIARYAAV